MKPKLFALFLIAGLLATHAARAAEADAILGVWHTTDKRGQVEIYKDKNKYAGKIISLKEPDFPADDDKGMAGKPKTDRENPDPKLRKRPIVGLEIMNGFTHDSNKVWDGGKIYDPENGKTYKCKLTLTSTNRLEVRGFIGFSLLGRTEVWTR